MSSGQCFVAESTRTSYGSIYDRRRPCSVPSCAKAPCKDLIAEECERAGVTLELVTEPLDSSPEGQLLTYVKGYAAKIEREKSRERNLCGRKTRVLSGKVLGAGYHMYAPPRNESR